MDRHNVPLKDRLKYRPSKNKYGSLNRKSRVKQLVAAIALFKSTINDEYPILLVTDNIADNEVCQYFDNINYLFCYLNGEEILSHVTDRNIHLMIYTGIRLENHHDVMTQMRIIEHISPISYSCRFQVPYGYKNFEYLAGTLHRVPYSNPTNSLYQLIGHTCNLSGDRCDGTFSKQLYDGQLLEDDQYTYNLLRKEHHFYNKEGFGGHSADASLFALRINYDLSLYNLVTN